MKQYHWILAIFFVGFTCPLYGQLQQKRELSRTDYSLWSKIEMQNASKKGEWISYNVSHTGQADTLFIKNKEATRTYGYAKGFDGKFIDDRWFICQVPQAVVQVTDLKKGTLHQITNVIQHDVCSNGDYIIYTTDKGITLTSPDGTIKWAKAGVKYFSASPAGTAIVYNTSEQIFYMEFKNGEVSKPKFIAEISGCSNTVFAWQRNGASFAFGSQCEGSDKGLAGLSWYDIAEDSVINFHLPSVDDISEITPDVTGNTAKFKVSDDGSLVFFPIKSPENKSVNGDNVQIWSGNSALTYGEEVLYGKPENVPKVMAWRPTSGQCVQLTTNDRPNMFLSGDQRYAVSYNAQGTAPNFDFYQRTNYYITNIASKRTELFLKDQSADQLEITASPSGKYIAYRKHDSWWVYRIATRQHINISEVVIAWFSKNRTVSNDKFTLDMVGWLSEDQGLLLNDGFDMWQVNLSNLEAGKITDGRENNRRFHLVPPFDIIRHKMNFDGFVFPQINTEQHHILQSLDIITKQYGYHKWSKGSISPMVSRDKNLSQLIYTAKNPICYYVEQDFNSPPMIVAGLPSKKTKVIYRSNSQHDKFYWGHSKVVSYTNSKGSLLQAGLYYPANFDPDKKYPLVVYVYEELSSGIHDYINPSMQNYTGFNITNLTAMGYFVLCPDIVYQTGDVGISAADCILSATRSVKDTAGINAGKIALFGHSFGGYEAAFTATQTNLFTTIIAGAAITDMASAYISISTNGAKPNMWRFEKQQWRMDKSLFEDQQSYQRNSTISHAERINTPMLLFTGDNDGQVDMKQSIELYLALRRLGKPEILLIYPGEGHVLMNQKNQEDFTVKLEQWLNYFLKDDPAPDWMKMQF